MNTAIVRLIALALALALLEACAGFPPERTPIRAVDADLLAADELVRQGNYAGAESQLLAGRSGHPKHSTPWRSYTLKLAEVMRGAGQDDKACGYRHETNPGEVVRLPERRDALDPAGPRQRRIAEAVASFDQDDFAAARAAFAALRKEIDPQCPAALDVAAAEMVAALSAGDLRAFLAAGAQVDAYFGDRRIVLPGHETEPVFRIYAAYRAIAQKPLPLNTPAATRDRLAFFNPS